ncbi:MAG: citrate lyase acyl carrier protein [Eubacteriales bacterium]|nr:citrate lyase acyl carrier protein [Eubacteriales bacterium]
MELKQAATCGTHASSDVYIEVYPDSEVLEINIDSPVKAQFGEAIDQTVREVLADYGLTKGRVQLQDQGALDCTIRARLKTALERGGLR